MVNTYNDLQQENHFVRTFREDVPEDELVWHRDHEDRMMTVLECGEWYFQFDNELPKKLSVGDTIEIKKMIYHRLIKESGRLIIKIVESK